MHYKKSTKFAKSWPASRLTQKNRFSEQIIVNRLNKNPQSTVITTLIGAFNLLKKLTLTY